MGGACKALAMLAGRPMLEHVIERVAPQVGALALSVESASPALSRFGLPQLADPMPGHRGPLGGLLAGLRYFAPTARWLLLVPCDAPFLPRDLADRLAICADAAGAPAAVAEFGGELQPTFSLWSLDVLPRLAEAAEGRREGGFKPFLRHVNAARCEWPAAVGEAGSPRPFFNVNEPADLERASRWLGVRSAGASAC